MSENKTGKYLKYAIGEILLVVIGILIALSINNWNEYKKERIEEKLLLIDIKEALISDLNQQFQKHLNKTLRVQIETEYVINHLENKLPYNDSLGIYFGILTAFMGFDWSPQLTPFKRLESGINIIENRELQAEILDIYNSDYPRITKLMSNYKVNIYDYGRPLGRKNFRPNYYDGVIDNEALKIFGSKYYSGFGGMVPKNYEMLLNNDELYNVIRVLWEGGFAIKIKLLDIKDKVEDLVRKIDEELESKN